MNMAQMIKIPTTWIGPIVTVVFIAAGLYGVYMTTMAQTENALAQQAAAIENVEEDITEIEDDQERVTETIKELDEKIDSILISVTRIETILESE